MNYNQPRGSWKPSVPDPKLFQVQKPRSKAVAIKTPSHQGNTTLLQSQLGKTGIKPLPAEDNHGTTTSDFGTESDQCEATDSTICSDRQPRAESVASATTTGALGARAREDPRQIRLSGSSENIPRSIPESAPDSVRDRSLIAAKEGHLSAPANTNGHIDRVGLRTGFDSPEENIMSTLPTKDQHAVPTWKPDVFVHAFIPRPFLAVNNAPARPVISQAVEGINFPRYVSTFASPLFLPPMFSLTQSPTISRLGLLRSDNLSSQDYKCHFIDCLMLDLEAQTPEVRSYDLFGVELEIVDFGQRIFSLHVPGLREGAPRVSFGDIVMLRQLVLDPITKLPLGMEYWEKSGGRDRGESAPGFTGLEITGTVVAVIKQHEKLHLRLAGVIAMPLVFNVSFVVQGRSVYSLQRIIADIAHELTSNSARDVSNDGDASLQPMHTSDASQILQSDDKNCDGLAPATKITSQSMNIIPEAVDNKHWLYRMLFPSITDGVLQTSLPQGVFQQNWYDQDLNYEQMVRNAPNASKSLSLTRS